jgi:hypothetical protein
MSVESADASTPVGFWERAYAPLRIGKMSSSSAPPAALAADPLQHRKDALRVTMSSSL